MTETMQQLPLLQNFIGGTWVASSSSRVEDVPNPATRLKIAQVPLSNKEDVAAAVIAAENAFPEWSKTPAPKRARILFKYHALLIEHQEELAELITQENGKSYEDAYGEVLRGIECVEFAAGAPTLLMGSVLPEIAPSIDSEMFRYPLGVVAGITPFNFPMMVPCWMFPLAIACGNTFILKPSERTPMLANRLAELFDQAGLPKGVLNIVHGAHDVVNGVIDHPTVKAISFVGSQPVAEYVYKTSAQFGKRVQALAGAKNHTIVMPDANLDKAVQNITAAAFGSAGERCMACSVVVAVGSIGDALVERLIAEADKLTIGNGLNKEVTLGPVIRESHLKKVIGYIEIGEQEGASLVRDGRLDQAAHPNGYFLGATIFDRVTPEMTIAQDEIFAPVLSIMRASDLNEAIELVNQSRFGNGACIFTDSGRAVRDFRERIEAGMLGVNVGVPAPMAFFPFCGWKQSFYGDLHANGKDGVEFYTKKKMITSRWYESTE